MISKAAAASAAQQIALLQTHSLGKGADAAQASAQLKRLEPLLREHDVSPIEFELAGPEQRQHMMRRVFSDARAVEAFRGIVGAERVPDLKWSTGNDQPWSAVSTRLSPELIDLLERTGERGFIRDAASLAGLKGKELAQRLEGLGFKGFTDTKDPDRQVSWMRQVKAPKDSGLGTISQTVTVEDRPWDPGKEALSLITEGTPPGGYESLAQVALSSSPVYDRVAIDIKGFYVPRASTRESAHRSELMQALRKNRSNKAEELLGLLSRHGRELGYMNPRSLDSTNRPWFDDRNALHNVAIKINTDEFPEEWLADGHPSVERVLAEWKGLPHP